MSFIFKRVQYSSIFKKRSNEKCFGILTFFLKKHTPRNDKAISTGHLIASELTACFPSLLTREQTVR